MKPVIAAAVLALSASSVPAGVVMEFTDKSPGQAPGTSKAYIGADRARIESGGQVLIFRGDKQLAWAIDPQQGTAVEMTKEGMSGMADAMKQMQAELAALPADQRAMVESMMKQQMGGAAAPAAPAPITWAVNGKSDTVGGRACTGYDGTRAGKVEDEICATDWTTFGLTREDFRALEMFAEFMQGIAGPFAQQARSGFMEADMPGVPLRSITRTPQGEHVHELTKVEKSDVAASLFELPAGTKVESMEGMAAPGGRGRR